MDIKNVNTSICISPSDLGYNLFENLKERIKEKLLNNCFEKYGYINRIMGINKIIDTCISPTLPDVIITLDVSLECLFPYKDRTYTGKICMIFNRGIFTQINDKLKVLVPIDKIDGFEFNELTNTFDDKKGNSLKKGDEIDVNIYDYKYSNKNFNCLGIMMR